MSFLVGHTAQNRKLPDDRFVKAALDDAMSYSDMARRWGVNSDSVRQLVLKRGWKPAKRVITDKQIEKCLDLGLSEEETAEEVGLELAVVQRRIEGLHSTPMILKESETKIVIERNAVWGDEIRRVQISLPRLSFLHGRFEAAA